MVASAKIRAPRVLKRSQADDTQIELPNDIQAEEALLGSLLIDRDALREIKAAIPNFCAEHFYRPLHKSIYAAIAAIGTNDTIAIAGYLKDHGVEEANFELGQLVNRVASPDYAVSAAWRVYDKARSRAQIGVAQAMMMAGLHGDLAKFDELMTQAERLKEDYVPPAARTLETQTLAEICATEYPELNWLVKGLIPEGLTLLVGAPKGGKSTLALGAFIAIASGGLALGSLQCEKNAVLYLALEDSPRRLKYRAQRMLAGQPAPEWMYVANEAPTLDDGLVEQLERWLDANQHCKLVCIDTLQKVRGQRSDEDLYGEDSRMMYRLKKLADDRHIAVVVIHHTRKAEAADWLSKISGTNGLAGAADSILLLERVRGKEDGVLYATGRDVEEAEWAVRFNKMLGTWELLGDATEVKMTREQNDMLEVIKDMEQAAVKKALERGEVPEPFWTTPMLVKKELGDKKYDTIKSIMYRMEKAGILAVYDGKYTIVSKSAPAAPAAPHAPHAPGEPQGAEIEGEEGAPGAQGAQGAAGAETDAEVASDEPVAAFIDASTLIEDDSLAHVEEIVRLEVAAEWERRDWKPAQLAPHIKAGGNKTTAMAYLARVTGLAELGALLTAVTALGGA